ncbi:MAG: KTSC domain-containing protein [Chitinophagaceae bacterium]|nr:MAG: KTSC domain-containing protein [Chitinophagaceae bacterium]
MPSSVVRKLDYDPASNVLCVYFVSGRRYAYLEVPEDVYTRFTEAASKGTFLNDHIKGKFKYRKISRSKSG